MNRQMIAGELVQLAESLIAADDPAAMLNEKMSAAQALLKSLRAVDYTTYYIGDFYESEFPRLRKMSEQIRKTKDQFERMLAGFIAQAAKDMRG